MIGSCGARGRGSRGTARTPSAPLVASRRKFMSWITRSHCLRAAAARDRGGVPRRPAPARRAAHSSTSNAVRTASLSSMTSTVWPARLDARAVAAGAFMSAMLTPVSAADAAGGARMRITPCASPPTGTRPRRAARAARPPAVRWPTAPAPRRPGSTDRVAAARTAATASSPPPSASAQPTRMPVRGDQAVLDEEVTARCRARRAPTRAGADLLGARADVEGRECEDPEAGHRDQQQRDGEQVDPHGAVAEVGQIAEVA